MKKPIFIMSLLISSGVFAHENPDLKGYCLIVNGKNKPEPCTIHSGGGAGGMYTAFTVNKKDYLIEESTMIGHEGEASVGLSSADKLEDAISYTRDFKTKKIIKRVRASDWGCYKQVKGLLDVCVAYK